MATYYVDASRPNDTGDGLSEATAKRTPRAAHLAAASGSTILLKAGYCYDSLSGNFFYISGTSDLTIGSYGSASDKPILDALTYQNPGVGGWTHVSGGIWKKVFANFPVRRLWIGSLNTGILTTQRTIGTAMRRATNGLPTSDGETMKGTVANPLESTILPQLNAADMWFCGGSNSASSKTSWALYIYTGSASIDPPTYYQGIAFIQSDGSTVGAVEPIHVENQTGIYVRDLHIRGSGGSAIRLYAQNSNSLDVADCLFEDITVTHPYLGAFQSRIAAQATPAWRIKSCTARRIYCDYAASEFEMELDTSYDFLSGVSDSFDIGEGSVGVIVRNCHAENPAHGGLVAHSKGMRTVPPSGCKMLNNSVRFSPWHTYGRGINALDGDTLVQGNLIDGQTTRTQLGGSVEVVGNVWVNMRDSIRKPDVAQWITCESYIYPGSGSGLGNEVYLQIWPVNIRVHNNTVYSPVDEAVKLSFYTSSGGDMANSFNAGTVSVRNNVVHQLSGKFLTTYEDTGKIIGQQNFQNNCAYNGSTSDNKIIWRGSSYTINAAPGCTGNIEVDPQIDENHRPQATECKRTGSYLGGKDYYGKHFYNPPNIGAVDDITDTPRYVLKRA